MLNISLSAVAVAVAEIAAAAVGGVMSRQAPLRSLLGRSPQLSAQGGPVTRALHMASTAVILLLTRLFRWAVAERGQPVTSVKRVRQAAAVADQTLLILAALQQAAGLRARTESVRAAGGVVAALLRALLEVLFPMVARACRTVT